MNRTTKQIVYGLVYGAIWFFVIYGGYLLTIKPPPTCTDNVQNRDETGVDCGGIYCQACEIKKLAPIAFGPVQLLSSADGKGTTALIEIRNTNVAYGTPTFSYSVLLYGSSTTPVYHEDDTAPIYPGEIKYRLVVNAPVAFASVTSAVATTSAPYVWQKITDLSRPKITPRSIQSQYNADTNKETITGIVKNDNAYAVHRVTISALLYDKSGKLIGVSKTFAQDLIAAEERYFKMDIPLPAGTDPATLTDPKVNVDAER